MERENCEIIDTDCKGEGKTLYTSDFKRDTNYWNTYYQSKPDIETPSLFAVKIGTQLKKASKLLDLGCGNGRDSLYFHRLGLYVTAVDASDIAIKMLQEEHKDKGIRFICDDFVSSPMIYAEKCDYCYSRFSLHAINEKQQDEFLLHIYDILEDSGRFFIEVRSVHDELYGKGEEAGRDAFIFDGHYRRFIRQEELEQKLMRIGFKMEYSKEDIGFAPFGNSDPPVIRMIVKK